MKKIPLKLVLTVAVSAAIITILLLILFFVRFQERRLSALNPAQGRFIQFLLREITVNPNPKTVNRLAATYQLHILVKKGKEEISSDPDYFHSRFYRELKREPWPIRRMHRKNQMMMNAKIRLLKDGHIPVGIELRKGDNRFVLVKYGNDRRVRRTAFLVTLSVIGILAFLFFLVKRWLADPLDELETAIRAFPDGMYTGEPVHGAGDLRRLFDAFNKMKEQVRQTVADKERLLRDISHDLKSPITRMRVAVEMLPASQNRDRILNDLSELQSLVNQVLETQRKKDFKREHVEIARFLREFLVSNKPDFPVQLQIRAPFSIRGNRAQLNRVLENLFSNTSKYANPEKGAVISCYTEGESGIIEVSDSGTGVDQNIITHIFDPFFKGDTSRRQDIQSGSGLGLSICKTIVETMGGEIKAMASETGGLRIRIRFPKVRSIHKK